MRRILPIVLLLLAAAPAQAQSGPDLKDLSPQVMLLVDTSGSMERQMGCVCSNEACSNCEPDCDLPNMVVGTDLRPPVAKQSRWMVTLEVLTGEFVDYQCEQLERTVSNGATYDLGYFRRYGQPWDCIGGGACTAQESRTDGVLKQKDNGILDNYRDLVLFGVMTFDGKDTYSGSPALIPRPRGQAGNYDPVRAADIAGHWSYGSYYGTDLSSVYQRPLPGVEADYQANGATPTLRVPGHFRYPNCPSEYQMDTGARNRDADNGALITLDTCGPAPAAPCNMAGTIEDALLETRPWGGTPIAGMLEDLYFYFEEDNQDPFAECRPKFGLLITDGKPDDDYRRFGCDCYDNTLGSPGYCGPAGKEDPLNLFCPYMRPADIARDLVQGIERDPQLDELYVIGLDLQDQPTIDALEEIAMEGGTELVQAGDTSALEAAISAIVQRNFTAVSRLNPVFTPSIDPAYPDAGDAAVKQYQISAGFRKGEDNLPWEGFIERRRLVCDSNQPMPVDLRSTTDEFHEVLNTQPGRTLWTYSSQLGAVLSGIINIDNCLDCEPHIFTRRPPLFPSAPTVTNWDLGVASDPERQEIIAWMVGVPGTPRDGRRLGDIVHSEPVIVGPPLADRTDRAFNIFRQKPEIANRPLTLYVNSNDGIIHAFAVEVVRDALGMPIYGPGEEMWGFVPPMLLNRVKDQLVSHQVLLDGTPVVKDVYMSRPATSTGTLVAAEYKTVLVTGMRAGGKGYVALDVSDPMKPRFMWQFTDQHMGETYAQPAIVQATLDWDNGVTTERQNRAIAVLPGGKGKLAADKAAAGCDPITGFRSQYRFSGTQTVHKTFSGPLPTDTAEYPHRDQVRCWEEEGRVLYFVDVETGRLIKKLYQDSGAPGRFFRSPLIGSPVAYSDEVGTEASRLFITDADGVIWRIDMSSPVQRTDTRDLLSADPPGDDWYVQNSSEWTARPFHDIFHDSAPDDGELSLARPALTLDESNNLTLVVGTGNTDAFEDIYTKNRVVALTERLAGTLDPSNPDNWRAGLRWQLMVQPSEPGFQESELVTGPPTISDGVVYFSTFIASTATPPQPCDYGSGRIWAVDLLNRGVPNDQATPLTYAPAYFDVLAGQAPDPLNPINVPRIQARADELFLSPTIDEGFSCEVVNVLQTDLDVGYGNFDVTAGSGITGGFKGVQAAAPPQRRLIVQGSSAAQAGTIQTGGGSQLGSASMNLDQSRQRGHIRGWAAGGD